MPKHNLIKIAVATVLTTVLGSISYAQTYKCDVLRDAQGHMLLSDSTYAVTTNANNGVTLVSTFYYPDAKGRLPHSMYTYMAPFETSRLETLYRAGDVVVTFENEMGRGDQVVGRTVTLTETMLNDTYTAKCD